jgi:hypothetical protein
MTIIVSGRLVNNAEARVWENRSTVFLLIDPGAGGFPVEARFVTGEGAAAADRAEKLARGWHKGAEVAAEGSKLFPRLDHGTAAVILKGVTGLAVDGVAVS